MLITNNQNNNQSKLLTKLLIVVTNWNWDNPKTPALKDQDNLFGSKCGANYLKNEFIDSKLEDYFQNVTCYLLPTRNSEPYMTYLDSLSQFHLFNIKVMPIMKDPRTNDNYKIDDFIKSFERYIDNLNEKHFEDPDYLSEPPSKIEIFKELTKQPKNKIGQNRDDQGSSSDRKTKCSNTVLHTQTELCENNQVKLIN